MQNGTAFYRVPLEKSVKKELILLCNMSAKFKFIVYNIFNRYLSVLPSQLTISFIN